MKIIVTRHAMDRMRERFRLKFHRYVNDPEMLKSLIIGQVSTAQRLDSWKQSPFLVNRMGWQYGPGVEIFLKSGVYYICVVKDGVCSVRTCNDRALIYRKVA